MAKNKSKSRNSGGGVNPGRLLLLVFAMLLAGGAAMAGTGAMSPKLAIDLDGGTQVTLTAKAIPGDDGKAAGKLTSDSMKQAVEIIRKRVNSFGVSEAQVTTLGSDNIIVAVPGENSGDVAEKVGQTALLRFRPVLDASLPGPSAPGDVTGPGEIPGLDNLGGTEDEGTKDQERPVSAALVDPTASPSPSPSPKPAAKASASPTPGATADAGEAPKDSTAALTAGVPKDVREAFFKLDCTKNDTSRIGDQQPASAYVAACDRDNSGKFLLGPSVVQGTQVTGAEAGLPQGTASVGAWQVNLNFNGQGTKDFAAITKKLSVQQPPFNQLAITLDGVVFSAPTVNEEIPNGSAQISGGFDQEGASDLANVLKYGALPLAFTQSKVETVSATLGEDQLNAGLIAGALGMVLVVFYGLFYYRGLGVAALAGLALAALMSYMAVTLLGEAIGYRLSIAGIAGLIVAIGITADSFVVYFERLRDEIREGRTPRVAVEQGWRRARRTILTANFVSLLASAVLYYFSVADVKGFAFTLGVVTVIDIVVIFLFTKPLVTLMMRRQYFARGKRWSGVSPESLGIRRPIPASRTVAKEA